MTQPRRDQRTTSVRSERRIPSFRTIEEEAEFWDTHDSADFEDEFEDVSDVTFVIRQPATELTVRLEPAALEALRKRARRRGIEPDSLARLWILEHLGEQGGRS